jgi:Ca2+-binding EF-hand superfamily protein
VKKKKKKKTKKRVDSQAQLDIAIAAAKAEVSAIDTEKKVTKVKKKKAAAGSAVPVSPPTVPPGGAVQKVKKKKKKSLVPTAPVAPPTTAPAAHPRKKKKTKTKKLKAPSPPADEVAPSSSPFGGVKLKKKKKKKKKKKEENDEEMPPPPPPPAPVEAVDEDDKEAEGAAEAEEEADAETEAARAASNAAEATEAAAWAAEDCAAARAAAEADAAEVAVAAAAAEACAYAPPTAAAEATAQAAIEETLRRASVAVEATFNSLRPMPIAAAAREMAPASVGEGVVALRKGLAETAPEMVLRMLARFADAQHTVGRADFERGMLSAAGLGRTRTRVAPAVAAIFDAFDEDGSGRASLDLLASATLVFSSTRPEDTCSTVFSMFDASQTGVMSRDELETFLVGALRIARFAAQGMAQGKALPEGVLDTLGDDGAVNRMAIAMAWRCFDAADSFSSGFIGYADFRAFALPNVFNVAVVAPLQSRIGQPLRGSPAATPRSLGITTPAMVELTAPQADTLMGALAEYETQQFVAATSPPSPFDAVSKQLSEMQSTVHSLSNRLIDRSMIAADERFAVSTANAETRQELFGAEGADRAAFMRSVEEEAAWGASPAQVPLPQVEASAFAEAEAKESAAEERRSQAKGADLSSLDTSLLSPQIMWAYKFGAQKLLASAAPAPAPTPAAAPAPTPAELPLPIVDAPARSLLATPSPMPKVHVNRHGSVDIRGGTMDRAELAAMGVQPK